MKYSDYTSEPQIVALDLIHNTKYAQPIMDRRMREAEAYLVMTILNRQYQSLTN